MPSDADVLYRELFAHPEMVRDLLRVCVPHPWAQALDLSVFERVNASYVSASGRQRHADVVWRLKVGRDWVYVYLLLEFQSRPDRWMALRMQVYVGLLYQDLVAQRRLSRHGKLPPVLPVVLYHGARPWRASTALAALMLPPPAGLETPQPEQKYLLVDQSKHARHDGAGRGNLVAALFALSRARTSENVRAVLQTFAAWIGDDENESLRASLTRWMQTMLRGEFGADADLPLASNLKEVHRMWNRKYATIEAMMIDEKIQKYKQQGRREGRQEGQKEGRLDGLREVLRKLIVKGGAPLSTAVLSMIEAAPSDQLSQWIDALLDGADPAQMFDAQ